jgi:hypothetical protein
MGTFAWIGAMETILEPKVDVGKTQDELKGPIVSIARIQTMPAWPAIEHPPVTSELVVLDNS